MAVSSLSYELRTGSFPLFARSQKCRSVPMVHLNNRGPSQRFEPVSRSFVPKSVPKSCGRWAAQQTVNPTLASFPIWAGRQADLADAVVRGQVTAYAAARQKGWRPPRIELRDPTVVAARIREHFSASRSTCSSHCLAKETYDEPRESVYCRPVEFAARRSRRRSTEARPHRPTRPHLANAAPC